MRGVYCVQTFVHLPFDLGIRIECSRVNLVFHKTAKESDTRQRGVELHPLLLLAAPNPPPSNMAHTLHAELVKQCHSPLLFA